MRIPIDTAVALIDREGKGAALRLSVDRVDTAARRVAGRVLHDEQLKNDAEQREIAIEQRARALQLRSEAELRREWAADEFEDEMDDAKKQRAAAKKRAKKEHEKIAEEERTERERVAATTRTRKAANNKVSDLIESQIDDRSQKTRLAQLEKEAEVLDARDESLVAESEAQRLERKASEVKAERKSS
jgi:colicin import membrane protein